MRVTRRRKSLRSNRHNRIPRNRVNHPASGCWWGRRVVEDAIQHPCQIPLLFRTWARHRAPARVAFRVGAYGKLFGAQYSARVFPCQCLAGNTWPASSRMPTPDSGASGLAKQSAVRDCFEPLSHRSRFVARLFPERRCTLIAGICGAHPPESTPFGAQVVAIWFPACRAGKSNPLKSLVGETGFEPATLCSQSRCATRLRHSPPS